MTLKKKLKWAQFGCGVALALIGTYVAGSLIHPIAGIIIGYTFGTLLRRWYLEVKNERDLH